jgi:putative transposase
MLVIEGQVVNHKRTYRVYCEEGLQVCTRRRKKIVRPRAPMAVPDAVNQRWSMDFVSDQLANGRRFRVLNIVDDFSREYVLKIVDFSISGHRVSRELDRISRSLPKMIVCDNGPEFTSKAMYFWAKRAGVKLHFIQPGKPTQNAFVESFNGKLREYCLDLNTTTTTSGRTDPPARNHQRCSLRKPPDMITVPHQGMLESRGAVTPYNSFE